MKVVMKNDQNTIRLDDNKQESILSSSNNFIFPTYHTASSLASISLLVEEAKKKQLMDKLDKDLVIHSEKEQPKI